MEIFQVIIEAGIGLAGFAGVVIVLSGDSKNWLYEEKLRMGLMLILFLTPVFSSFLCLVFQLAHPPEIVGYWLSIFVSTFIMCCCVVFFLLAKQIYGSPGTTYSAKVAAYCHGLLILTSLITLFNAFYEFAPLLSMLSGLLVCSMLIGSVIFFRILFLRPRVVSDE
jgi:hypothetical protein